MKKLIVLCISLVLFAGKGMAQYANVQPRAFDLKQQMALNSPYHYQRYKSGSTLSGIGTGLTLGGVAVAVIGVAVADKETEKTGTGTQVNLSGPGAGLFAAGIVSAVVGTPLWIIGSTKKKKARNAYLREFGYSLHIPEPYSPSMQIHTSPTGLGLAFVF